MTLLSGVIIGEWCRASRVDFAVVDPKKAVSLIMATMVNNAPNPVIQRKERGLCEAHVLTKKKKKNEMRNLNAHVLCYATTHLCQKCGSI